MTERILVVGLGNPDRGDDGVGPAVVDRLAGRIPADVGLRKRAGDLLELLGECEGLEALICIDAAAGMDSPGAVQRIDLACGPLPAELGSAMSSHALGLADALALGGVLGLLPKRVIDIAIGGDSFELGTAISEPTAAAIDPASDLVLVELTRLQQQGHADA